MSGRADAGAITLEPIDKNASATLDFKRTCPDCPDIERAVDAKGTRPNTVDETVIQVLTWIGMTVVFVGVVIVIGAGIGKLVKKG